jgi:hypothetical protein
MSTGEPERARQWLLRDVQRDVCTQQPTHRCFSIFDVEVLVQQQHLHGERY